MARNPTTPARVKPAPSKDLAKVAGARADLLSRGAAGALASRADPHADAKAAPMLVEVARAHMKDLVRRGLLPEQCDAALELAAEVEAALSALPAASLGARGRNPEETELLADAAAQASMVRQALLRVMRAPDGRAAAHDLGLGETFNARQPGHVRRALLHLIKGLKAHPGLAQDAGVLGEDVVSLKELAVELELLSKESSTRTDESEKLHAAHAGLRAFFDLVAAKLTMALAGDPEELARALALLPRAHDRRRKMHG